MICRANNIRQCKCNNIGRSVAQAEVTFKYDL